jgi:UDP-N-acetylglucosamine acyltransferase
MPKIHPSAIVEPGAKLGAGVEIGAQAIIGPDVSIGPGTMVGARAILTGRTTIGSDNQIHANAVIGSTPQDKKYAGEPTVLEIGDRNTFREFVTVNTGTVQDQGRTRIGNDNWIMAYVHVAHDCVIGNHVTLANCTQLGGHVVLDDWVTLGGFTGVHQFCRVGAHVMTSVGTTVLQDIPPYLMCAGQGAKPHGLNVEGLRRRGFGPEQIAALKQIYRTLYRNGLGLDEAREQLQARLAALRADAPPESLFVRDLECMVSFLAHVTRSIVR